MVKAGQIIEVLEIFIERRTASHFKGDERYDQLAGADVDEHDAIMVKKLMSLLLPVLLQMLP